MEISAVIPAHNEADSVEEIIKQCKLYCSEVIVVDDGSIDETYKISRSLGVTVIRNPSNLGVVKSTQIGLRRATRDIMVTLDADGQHDPSDIPVITRPIIHGLADLVLGKRERDIPISERLIAKLVGSRVECRPAVEVNAIWTNSPMLVRTMQRLFEDLWSPSRSGSDVLVPESREKKAPLETKVQTVAALQEEFAKYLTALGFEVKKDCALAGDSGTEHVFSLALFRDDERPIVIDLESSGEPITCVRVIGFLVKRFDVQSLVADATLVVKPNLDSEARKLAMSYHIKFTELG